jgi:6-pyruvoyltetrahydropterin/6-carboxytetrahydropterin synthase
MNLTVCKTFRFEAAHELPYHGGKCKEEHGHSYRVLLCVRGPVQVEDPSNPESGMVVDFSTMKMLWGPLDVRFDHTKLNKTLRNPTAERLCEYIVKFFTDFSDLQLVKVQVHETDDSYVEWNADD